MPVPASISPHKPAGEAGHEPASAAHRVEMLRLAFDRVPRCWICTDEVDRAGSEHSPSYWVDTLERVRGTAGGARDVRFLIGADQAAVFHRWREPRRILDLAAPVVIPRGGIVTADDLVRELRSPQMPVKAGPSPIEWTRDELDRWAASFVAIEPIGVSSTAVREGRARPEDLPPRVAAYLREHGLGDRRRSRLVIRRGVIVDEPTPAPGARRDTE